MGIQMGEAGDVPSQSEGVSYVQQYEEIAKSWWYEGELTNIVLWGWMLGFWHNGQLIYCPAMPKDVYVAQVEIANHAEEDNVGFMNMDRTSEFVATILKQ